MRGASRYKNTAVETSSQEQLVVTLIEGALRRQHMAVECIERQDFPAMNEHLRIVREILGELHAALDHEAAPKLAQELSGVYTWGILEIGRATRERDADRIRQVERVLVVLRDAWYEVVRAKDKAA